VQIVQAYILNSSESITQINKATEYWEQPFFDQSQTANSAVIPPSATHVQLPHLPSISNKNSSSS